MKEIGQSETKISSVRQAVVVFAIILLPVIILSLLGYRYALPVGVLITAAVLWFSELIPAPATALLVPAMIVLLGIEGQRAAFAPFGSEILFLFIGCFLIGQAMVKHRLDQRLAYKILTRAPGVESPNRLVGTIAALCWLLSMWISNTAAVAMIVPICVGIVNVFKEQLGESEELRRFQVRLLITCAFAGSIGGLATPIGSPPNLIAVELLSQRGIEFSFLSWAAWAVPLSALALAGLLYAMGRLYPLGEVRMPGVREVFSTKLKELGSISIAEIIILITFVVLIGMWVSPELVAHIMGADSPLATWLNERLPLGASAILASSILFVLPAKDRSGLSKPILDWSDGRAVEWGTVMLFGGGLALGQMLNSSGAAAALGEQIAAIAGSSIFLLAVLGAIFALVFSEFASNTAAAAVVLPLLLASAGSDPTDATIVAILSVCGATFGFMLPVSTPPNAIVYGTGLVPGSELLRAGWRFDLLGLLLSTVFVFVVFG